MIFGVNMSSSLEMSIGHLISPGKTSAWQTKKTRFAVVHGEVAPRPGWGVSYEPLKLSQKEIRPSIPGLLYGPADARVTLLATHVELILFALCVTFHPPLWLPRKQ